MPGIFVNIDIVLCFGMKILQNTVKREIKSDFWIKIDLNKHIGKK